MVQVCLSSDENQDEEKQMFAGELLKAVLGILALAVRPVALRVGHF